VAGSERGARHGQPFRPKQRSQTAVCLDLWDGLGPGRPAGVRGKSKIRRQDEKKARWELYSDHNGEFAQRVPAGKADYFITADLKAYKPPNGVRFHSGGEVQVHVDYDERVDTGLYLK